MEVLHKLEKRLMFMLEQKVTGGFKMEVTGVNSNRIPVYLQLQPQIQDRITLPLSLICHQRKENIQSWMTWNRKMNPDMYQTTMKYSLVR